MPGATPSPAEPATTLAPEPAGTEQRILTAAIRLLADDAKASMSDVASATGVGRATLYRHFASREELLRAIRLQSLRECRQALEDVPAPDAVFEEGLRQVIAALLRVLDRYRVLVAAPRRTGPTRSSDRSSRRSSGRSSICSAGARRPARSRRTWIPG